jgi:hypothetical protein
MVYFELGLTFSATSTICHGNRVDIAQVPFLRNFVAALLIFFYKHVVPMAL